MIRPNKDDRKGNLSEMRELSSQLEISQEIARIALKCPTCRDMVKSAIIKIKYRKNKKSSDFSSQEESQTEFLNPNNNAAENGISNGEVISNEINTHKYK
jgi:hypothetical protein